MSKTNIVEQSSDIFLISIYYYYFQVWKQFRTTIKCSPREAKSHNRRAKRKDQFPVGELEQTEQ
jgi:hypothetical protein